jgi:chromosome segregation ATPase
MRTHNDWKKELDELMGVTSAAKTTVEPENKEIARLKKKLRKEKRINGSLRRHIKTNEPKGNTENGFSL